MLWVEEGKGEETVGHQDSQCSSTGSAVAAAWRDHSGFWVDKQGSVAKLLTLNHVLESSWNTRFPLYMSHVRNDQPIQPHIVFGYACLMARRIGTLVWGDAFWC